jgi:hypothetical protein
MIDDIYFIYKPTTESNTNGMFFVENYRFLLLKNKGKYALNGATGIFLYSFTLNGMFFVEN